MLITLNCRHSIRCYAAIGTNSAATHFAGLMQWNSTPRKCFRKSLTSWLLGKNPGLPLNRTEFSQESETSRIRANNSDSIPCRAGGDQRIVGKARSSDLFISVFLSYSSQDFSS